MGIEAKGGVEEISTNESKKVIFPLYGRGTRSTYHLKWEKPEFRYENKMVGIISCGMLQKIWAVV